MHIQLIAKIYKRIKAQPGYLGFFLLYIIIVIIYFPKYLYHLIRKQKIIAFDWGEGTYSDFYLPLFQKLEKIGLKTIFFFNFEHKNQFGLTIFRKGLPRIYGDLFSNKIILCATSSKYKKLPIFNTCKNYLLYF